MRCVECGSDAMTERPERTAQGYRRFRCRACGKQIKNPAPRGGVFGEVSHYPPLAIETPGSLREQATPQAAGNATRSD